MYLQKALSHNELACVQAPMPLKQIKQILNSYWTVLSKISLSVSGKRFQSVICQSWRLMEIINLRDTDKSVYFAIPEFNNCFIIWWSPSLFSYLNHSLTNQGSDLPFFIQVHGYNYTWAEFFFFSKTHLKGYHAWVDHFL